MGPWIVLAACLLAWLFLNQWCKSRVQDEAVKQAVNAHWRNGRWTSCSDPECRGCK